MKPGLFATVALCLLLSGCIIDFDSAAFTEDFHRSFQVEPGASLTIDNANGHIDISGSSSGNTVDVAGTKFASSKELLRDVQVEMNSSGNAVTIRTSHPDIWMGNAGAHLTIRVPRKITLPQIHTSNGALHIADIEGSQHLQTSNGRITLLNLRGDVEAQTSNGRIETHDLEGDVNLRTSNGRIEAEAARGRFQARTSNGKIIARVTDPSPSQTIRVESSNGDVQLKLDGQQIPDVYVRTSNSAIRLDLPSGANLNVEAHATHGSVSSSFDSLRREKESHHSEELNGKLGAGGHTARLETSNGKISIEKH